MKKIAIIQSSYIPWKGYFDIINSVDEFIIYDNVQYSKNSWRNRNLIKLENGGTHWLTIPIKGKFGQLIQDVQIANSSWMEEHWNFIKLNYAKAPYYSEFSPSIKKLYERAAKEVFLSPINYIFLQGICAILEINTILTWSTDYKIAESTSSERVLNLCLAAAADIYLSGPSAQNYLDENLFAKHRVKVEWVNYEGYPEYHQFGGDFIHTVSILDMIFNLGKSGTMQYMKRKLNECIL